MKRCVTVGTLRRASGLSQRDLASLAGVSTEHSMPPDTWRPEYASESLGAITTAIALGIVDIMSVVDESSEGQGPPL